MAIMKVFRFPDPILKEKAIPIKTFDRELQDLSNSMFETMYSQNGIGLAANQVGILKQLIVVDLKSAEEDSSLREPKIFINPNIIFKSGESAIEEGCLSVIDFRAEIKRFESITVEYNDIKGNSKVCKAEGLLSICLQHEIDHLNGILFIDHLPLLKQKMVKKRLSKISSEAA